MGEEEYALLQFHFHAPGEATISGRRYAADLHLAHANEAGELAVGDYFTYQGSLTTPPCTEGVRWFVMTEPLTLSTEQVVAYVDRFGKTARPVQPTNGRKVEHYVD